MKIIYLDCSMGAAGNMLSAALFELLEDMEKEQFLSMINNAGIPGVEVFAEKSEKCGIVGSLLHVLVHGLEEKPNVHDHNYSKDEIVHCQQHTHTSLREITDIIRNLNLSEKVKADVISVYTMIAEAESVAHGRNIAEIHFHEVGTMDAIADIASAALLMDMIAPEKVIASPVHVGSGHVQCAHGILPVPAPATAHILQNVPIYGGEIHEELCTPTGAALLKYYVTDFGEMPIIKILKIGYGMGTKNLPMANCIRAFLAAYQDNKIVEGITELSCNLDDMTAEQIAFAQEILLANGALEVYTIPAAMKKSRLGVVFTVLAESCNKEDMLRLIFKHTTTLGVRESILRRYRLERQIIQKKTPWGDISVKKSHGYGINREKYEYDDLAQFARETGKSLEEISDAISGR